MAVYSFVCRAETCALRGIARRQLLARAELSAWQEAHACAGCGGELARDAVGPGVSRHEIMDNGAMTRAVEMRDDAEELEDEHVRVYEER